MEALVAVGGCVALGITVGVLVGLLVGVTVNMVCTVGGLVGACIADATTGVLRSSGWALEAGPGVARTGALLLWAMLKSKCALPAPTLRANSAHKATSVTTGRTGIPYLPFT